MATYEAIEADYLRLREGDAQQLSDRPPPNFTRSNERARESAARPQQSGGTDRTEAGGRGGLPRGSAREAGASRKPSDRPGAAEGRRKLILDHPATPQSLSAAVAAPVPDNDVSWSPRSAYSRLAEGTLAALDVKLVRAGLVIASAVVFVLFVLPKL